MQAGIVSFYQSKAIKTSIAISDVNSAIKYLLYNNNRFAWKDNDLSSYLNDNEREVTMFKHRWGFLNVIGATKVVGSKVHGKTAFEGYTIDETNNYCLYLLEKGTPLRLCGNSIIEGDVYLPGKGIKRGNLGNYPFTGKQLVNGKINVSKSMMPSVYYSTIDSVRNFFQFQLVNSIQDGFSSIKGDEGENEFTKPAKIIFDESDITLANISLKGKYIIESETSIIIDSSAKLEDIIIKAPYIEISDDFKGVIQCIASDSIFIGENCQLQYPSVVALITHDKPKSYRNVTISGLSSVVGLIFIAPDNINQKSTLFTLSESASVRGQVFCNGLFEAGGEITGNTICRSTILFTSSSIHENYLLNTRLLNNRQPGYLNILPGIFNKSKKDILKWL